MDALREKVDNCTDNVKEVKMEVADHERRITNLEISNSSVLVEIKHLVDSVKGLISMLKWGFGIALTTLLGFFVWYIQNL